MAKTEEQMYDEAWGEEAPGETAEQAPDAGGGEDAGAPGLAIVIGAEPAEAPAEEGAAESPAEEAMAEEAETPEEEQRRKSWEGRQKKRDDELAARAAELDARAAELEAAKAALPVAATGDIAEIVARLNDDFGEDFVSNLLAVIDARAGDAAGKVGSRVDQLSRSIQAALQGMHESAILEAHPDMDDIVGSDEFKAWLDGQDEEKRASAEAVMKHGMWPQIIRLVQTFKDQRGSAEVAPTETPDTELPDPFDEAAAPPASAAVRLPSAAAAADDFDAAWDEATTK